MRLDCENRTSSIGVFYAIFRTVLIECCYNSLGENMKRIFRLAVCVILCTLTVTANLCAADASAESGFFSQVDMLHIESHIEEYAGCGSGATVQGACVDGDYAYFAFMNGSVCNIAKFDAHSWEYIEKEKIINMGHSNDMTYNSDKDYLVVANNAPYYDVITLVDPDTLAPIKDVKIDEDIYAIAYNASRDCYVVGLSGTYDFALLDSDFEVIEEFDGVNTGYTRQGCDCDDDYIYFVQSGGHNLLVVYDYEGNHITDIPMDDTDEVENIFHIGNTFYTSLYYYGNTLYRIGFNPTSRISYHVSYDPGEGEGEMKGTTVVYGESTKLRECGFTRDGYLFGGWRAQRTCDGKYIGRKNGSDEIEWLDKEDVYDYVLYEDEEAVATTVRYGNVKLTAQWIAEQYKITMNSGTGEVEPQTAAVKHDNDYVIPDNGYVKEGFVFDGYTASRSHDNRVYGYRKNSDKPEWLNESDAASLHHFRPDDKVKNLTPDGTVILTAQYRSAYTFGDSGSTLIEYFGSDEKVIIPDRGGELKTLAEGAIKDNESMRDLYIPAGVRAIHKQSIANCPKLNNIYFEGELPEEIDGDCYVGDEAVVLYQVKNGQPFCIGFLSDEASLPVIHYLSRSLNINLTEVFE